jgi:hypothetical protein
MSVDPVLTDIVAGRTVDAATVRRVFLVLPKPATESGLTTCVDRFFADEAQGRCAGHRHTLRMPPSSSARWHLHRGRRHGPKTMLYQGKNIGHSDEPILAAARWLLDNRAAWLDETVVTYRGETLCMSGKVGEMAKLPVVVI